MPCHRAEVAKDFWCYRLCFLQCDWWREISLQKVINVNEARGIGRMSPDPLSHRWSLGTRLWFGCFITRQDSRCPCTKLDKFVYGHLPPTSPLCPLGTIHKMNEPRFSYLSPLFHCHALLSVQTEGQNRGGEQGNETNH